MLSRSQRLSVEQFNAIMEKGRVIHSPLFLIRYLTNTAGMRIAAVAPKKIAGTAVIRNKTRRRIYTIVRDLLKDQPEQTIHAILIAKQQVLTADMAQISSDIKDLFVKTGLLR